MPYPPRAAGTASAGPAARGGWSCRCGARGRTLGVLTLARAVPAAALQPGRPALAEDLAGRAAIALDNARLYRDIQEADRRKDEFLAMLAHELRNPLAPIRNAVQVLRLVEPTDDQHAVSGPRRDRPAGGSPWCRLVDDLLDVSRITRGKIALRTEPVDLARRSSAGRSRRAGR